MVRNSVRYVSRTGSATPCRGGSRRAANLSASLRGWPAVGRVASLRPLHPSRDPPPGQTLRRSGELDHVGHRVDSWRTRPMVEGRAHERQRTAAMEIVAFELR